MRNVLSFFLIPVLVVCAGCGHSDEKQKPQQLPLYGLTISTIVVRGDITDSIATSITEYVKEFLAQSGVEFKKDGKMMDVLIVHQRHRYKDSVVAIKDLVDLEETVVYVSFDKTTFFVSKIKGGLWSYNDVYPRHRILPVISEAIVNRIKVFYNLLVDHSWDEINFPVKAAMCFDSTIHSLAVDTPVCRNIYYYMKSEPDSMEIIKIGPIVIHIK